MVEENSLRKTLDHFLQQKQRRLDELRALELTIRQIQAELGDVSPEASQIVRSNSGEDLDSLGTVGTASAAVPPRKSAEIRPDEFFGKSQGQAAKAYLEKVGHAVSLEELVENLRKGGCKVGGADPKRTLYISLVRNTRDFVPPQPGYVGLRSFYPDLKGSAANGKPRKTTRRPRKPSSRASEPKEKPPAGDLAVAVRQILSDGELHSPDSIAQEAQNKLGHAVPKIAVFGVLRRKGIEKVGDQFRLIK